MLEVKKTKAPVNEIKLEEPEQIATNGKEIANSKETAWHKTKVVTAKGVTAAKFIAGKISSLAGSAAELTKTKVAINNLGVALNKAYQDAGEKVRQLDEQNKLGEVKPHFSEELKRINDLKDQVKKSKKHAKEISFSK
jgi:hypothetical protein